MDELPRMTIEFIGSWNHISFYFITPNYHTYSSIAPESSRRNKCVVNKLPNSLLIIIMIEPTGSDKLSGCRNWSGKREARDEFCGDSSVIFTI